MTRPAMIKAALLIGILTAALPTQVAARDGDRSYEVGIRSAVIMGKMKLSGVDPVFDDLGFDGVKGPHMSGLFFLYRIRPHLRIGAETLVSSSDPDAVTTMNYQAAGPVVEFSYGGSWTIASGLHGGGLIVNAMARDGLVPSEGASPGSFYKGNGGFFAPYVGIGHRIRRHQLGVFVKRAIVFGEADRGGLSGFNAWFGGVRYAIEL